MAQTIVDRTATRLLEGISNQLWDLKANLMSDIVDQHGAAGSVTWFARNMPTYEKILKNWGPLRTHYLAVAVSAINGCGYCTYGHAYAFVLHHFDKTGELYPLSETDMADLNRFEGDKIAQKLEMALIEAGMEAEVPWLHRTVARLHNAPVAENQDDKWIDHLVQMFGWLNACGISADTTPDEAHDPINKRADLKMRYDEARAAAAS